MVQRWDSKGRPRALARGKKCPVDTFLVRGRIPGFPNAVRRTVGGKANVMKPSPTGGSFSLTKRRDSKGRPRRSLGKNCPVDIILCESPGLQMSLRANAHTGVALSKDSLRSQSAPQAFPSGVVLRAANQNLTIASGNCSIMYRWLARLPQARDG